MGQSPATEGAADIVLALPAPRLPHQGVTVRSDNNGHNVAVLNDKRPKETAVLLRALRSHGKAHPQP